MGKNQNLTVSQRLILAAVKENQYLSERFYFTGGTALSAVYLQHRFSEDLDFFSKEVIDFVELKRILRDWSKQFGFTYRTFGKERVLFSFLKFPGKDELKVDFGTYPFKQLKPIQSALGLKVDSLFDIAVNKLSVIGNRLEVRDFVDLYFLLKKFSLWDLLRGAELKFGSEPMTFMLSSDFTLVERFTKLPRMIKPLTLKQLKDYFRDQAKILGKTSVR
jgi:hypothetical protein